MKSEKIFALYGSCPRGCAAAGCTSTSNPSPSPSTATVSATTTAATSQLDKSDPRARAQLTGIDAWKHKRELWAKQKRKLA